LTVLTRREPKADLKCGALQKLWRCIYGRGEADTGLRLCGLDLAAGSILAVCLGTAAAGYGFDEGTQGLHVLDPGDHHLRPADGPVIHRRKDAPLTLAAGRPATSPSWTAIEVARRPAAAPRTGDARGGAAEWYM
jgi:hypothetical protein